MWDWYREPADHNNGKPKERDATGRSGHAVCSPSALDGKREIYSRACALERGTLFIDLDMPFMGKGVASMNKNELLRQICRSWIFAIGEAVLYLDTHPHTVKWRSAITAMLLECCAVKGQRNTTVSAVR